MTMYKVFFYDEYMRVTYPVSIKMPNICHLAEWINDYIQTWGVEFASCATIDDRGYRLENVQFLPSELQNNFFIVGLKDRLLAHVEYYGE